MRPVWLIESKDRTIAQGKGDWYPCWYDVYYSKKDSIQALKKLKENDAGFSYGIYRTARYERAKK